MKVKLITRVPQCTIPAGELCDLVGFVRCADDRPYAVLCSVEVGNFDYAPLHAITAVRGQAKEENKT